jgi:proteasome lid subunit RPN8/RPN11
MQKEVIVRCAAPEWKALREILFSRYPEMEWATFARFGWRETKDLLVVTVAAIDPPSGSDLDDRVGHVAISEPYSLRMAVGAEKHQLGVGVLHSHPENCPPLASVIDNDMDSYYSTYLGGFAPDRPYVSARVRPQVFD